MKRVFSSFRRFRSHDSGASAVEAALLAPVFIPLLVGTFELLFILYTSSALDRAAQAAVMEMRLGQSAGIAAGNGWTSELYYKKAVCERLDYPGCTSDIAVNVTTFSESGAVTANFSDEFIDPGTLARVDISLTMDVIGFMATLRGEPMRADTSLMFHTEPF